MKRIGLRRPLVAHPKNIGGIEVSVEEEVAGELISMGVNMPFSVSRLQFHVIAICHDNQTNKAQGQTFKKLGMYLPVFPHRLDMCTSHVVSRIEALNDVRILHN